MCFEQKTASPSSDAPRLLIVPLCEAAVSVANKGRHDALQDLLVAFTGVYGCNSSSRIRAWIPERSATRLREADLNVLSKLGKQGLEWRLEPEAFTGREVRREDDLLDFPVGCPVDIEVARQPSA